MNGMKNTLSGGRYCPRWDKDCVFESWLARIVVLYGLQMILLTHYSRSDGDYLEDSAG